MRDERLVDKVVLITNLICPRRTDRGLLHILELRLELFDGELGHLVRGGDLVTEGPGLVVLHHQHHVGVIEGGRGGGELTVLLGAITTNFPGH